MYDGIDQFRVAIRVSGLVPPDLISPGKWHRFPGMGKRHSNRSGYCMIFEDCIAGCYGDWSRDFHATWKYRSDKSIPREEIECTNWKLRELHVKREQERAERFAKAAAESREELSKSTAALVGHAYLRSKDIRPHGVSVNDNGHLLIPATCDGEIHSLQYIAPNGEKKFKSGGRIRGMYCLIGEIENPTRVLICEGFATGVTLFEDSGHLVAVGFYANNLIPVTENIRRRYLDSRILICADNDWSKPVNVGLRAAKEAADRCGVEWTYPDFTGLNPSPGDSDFNDYCRLMRCAA